MRYQWNAFRMALLLQLRSWKTWLLILLLPALTWSTLTLLPARERSAPVRVGVSLPREGGEAFWALLEARGGAVITFIQADEATVEGMVASGQWDCGLLLPEDFQERLMALDTNKLLTLMVSDASAAYPLVKEAAAACMTTLLSPGIAQEYLLESGMADEDRLVSPLLRQTLGESDRLLVTMSTLDGRSLDALALADDTLSHLLRGMVAIVLLIWTLLSAMDSGRWLSGGAALRLRPLVDTTWLLLPQIAAAVLPAFFSGALALCLLPEGRLTVLLPLAAYLVALCALALLAARARPVWTALPVLMPFVPALCLLLSPILFDLSAMSPALDAFSRWMPVTLYLRACEGAWQPGALLLAGAAGALALSLCVDRAGRLSARGKARPH